MSLGRGTYGRRFSFNASRSASTACSRELIHCYVGYLILEIGNAEVAID